MDAKKAKDVKSKEDAGALMSDDDAHQDNEDAGSSMSENEEEKEFSTNQMV